MGYNATIVVLVDQLSQIEKDPAFGEKLVAAIRAKMNDPNERYIRAPYVTGQTQVIEVHHADHQMVVAVGGNTGQVLGLGGSYRTKPDDMVQLLNAERLRRKRESKASLRPEETQRD